MDQPKTRFQRHVEDFTCDHCGTLVHGTGYTNHCPACLWSRHVDVKPGDRSESCKGMMEPIGVDTRGGYTLYYRCQACGIVRKNKVAEDDDMKLVAKLSAKPLKL